MINQTRRPGSEPIRLPDVMAGDPTTATGSADVSTSGHSGGDSPERGQELTWRRLCVMRYWRRPPFRVFFPGNFLTRFSGDVADRLGGACCRRSRCSLCLVDLCKVSLTGAVGGCLPGVRSWSGSAAADGAAVSSAGVRCAVAGRLGVEREGSLAATASAWGEGSTWGERSAPMVAGGRRAGVAPSGQVSGGMASATSCRPSSAHAREQPRDRHSFWAWRRARPQCRCRACSARNSSFTGEWLRALPRTRVAAAVGRVNN